MAASKVPTAGEIYAAVKDNPELQREVAALAVPLLWAHKCRGSAVALLALLENSGAMPPESVAGLKSKLGIAP